MLNANGHTGGGGGHGVSALGGAIEARRIKAFGVLSCVVCHGEEEEGEWKSR